MAFIFLAFNRIGFIYGEIAIWFFTYMFVRSTGSALFIAFCRRFIAGYSTDFVGFASGRRDEVFTITVKFARNREVAGFAVCFEIRWALFSKMFDIGVAHAFAFGT